MEKINNKKVSFVIILLSILFLTYGTFAKYANVPASKYFEENQVPLKYFDIDIFGISFDFLNFFLFLLISLGIGIYLLIYKNDQSLKNLIKKPKLLIPEKIKTSGNLKINKPEFLEKIKKNYTKFESSNLPKKEIEKTEQPTEDRATSIVGMVTIVAIIFTFFMATKVGFSLWFFIIYAYYHYLTLAPKSKKEILIKSIAYPSIFLFIFMLSESGDLYNMNRNIYGLSKHIIPFLLCVSIMYFTLRKQLGKPTSKFNFKNPLFWIALICFLASIFRYGVLKYIENS